MTLADRQKSAFSFNGGAMSQKTLNLCLERYNFVKFGETTKSTHTVLCTNNAHSVNSDKYRLTPTAIASKHGEGYVFTLNYDFDRPLFTIVQKSYSIDGTSGKIVFEGIDPISKDGSKYLRRVEVSPVKLSDGSYLLEVTKDEYLRIGTTGAALGDEGLESLNEKIVTMGGIEKSVETVGGKQVLKLDASGSSGAKEIVYFDVNPIDPPSGIHGAIVETISNNKLPVIRSDGKLYQYTGTSGYRYDFVGMFDHSDVGYEVLSVDIGNAVVVNKLDASLGYTAVPASGTDESPAWAKVCELDLKALNGYTTYGLALLFTSENNNDEGENVESGLFVADISSHRTSNSNSCNASWMAYTPNSDEYSKILGIKLIGKYGVPSNPVLAPYPIYKVEVWVKYYGSNEILVNALQNARYNYSYGVVQGLYKFPESHIAVPQSTEPSYSDTEEYVYKNFFYPAESPIVTTPKSFMLTPTSDWLTFDGTNDLVFGSVYSRASTEVVGDKIRMKIRDGETKYRVEGAKRGVYSFTTIINARWNGTPVNRKGYVFGYELDFSKNFELRLGPMPSFVKIVQDAQDFYGLTPRIQAGDIDAPVGLQVSISSQITYLGNVED